MREITERAVSRAIAAGASYADARAIVLRHQTIHTKNGSADALADSTEQGLGVRVIADGAWGFASTSSLASAEVDASAELAVRVAKASATLSPTQAELAPQEPLRGEWTSQAKVDPFSVPLKSKLGLLLEADGIMRAVPGIRVATGHMNFVREEKWFASSEGASIAQTRTQSGGMIQAMAEGAGEVQRRSFPSSLDGDNANRGWEFVESLGLVGNARKVNGEAGIVRRRDAATRPQARRTAW